MKNILGLLILVLTFSCKQEAKMTNADAIIEKAIVRAGGGIIDTANISFKFRDYFYRADRNEGMYKLERCTDSNCQDTLDVLTNSDFKRLINNKPVNLADSLITGFASSVNSVHYFSVLPYGLDAEAVNAKLIGEAEINGKSYYEIHVNFSENGGGEDFEDTYMYWISTEDFAVDYLAYNYHVNEGGTRFREAYNIREINGVRIVDYNNYEPEEQFPPLENLDSLFVAGKLKLLSKIELENVKVTPCSSC